jgi:hypothetical protein
LGQVVILGRSIPPGIGGGVAGFDFFHDLRELELELF